MLVLAQTRGFSAACYLDQSELHRLGIAVLYVIERIIRSHAETASIQGMHHIMNGEYSRKLSIRRSAGSACPMGAASDPSSQKQPRC
jgi:hypothetical protein